MPDYSKDAMTLLDAHKEADELYQGYFFVYALPKQGNDGLASNALIKALFLIMDLTLSSSYLLNDQGTDTLVIVSDRGFYLIKTADFLKSIRRGALDAERAQRLELLSLPFKAMSGFKASDEKFSFEARGIQRTLTVHDRFFIARQVLPLVKGAVEPS